jgi:hypothetical protein
LDRDTFITISTPLALMAMESPELEKLIFPGLKKRPKEALFRAWKNTFSSEDLQCTAGNSS